MIKYDPFSRGPFPVGVQTLELVDVSRERKLPVEFWYPAAESARGRDLDPEAQDQFLLMPSFPKLRQAAARDAGMRDGVFPLVIFSHGLAGHRRQTTHFCTHLASHGFLVAAMDHVGNTMPDIIRLVVSTQKTKDPAAFVKALLDSAADRPLDAIFTIDALSSGEFGNKIDPDRIGISGHSFGGWTTLATVGRDPRLKAALPLAPAGGRSKLQPGLNIFDRGFSLDWKREVPVLYLVADLDSLLPLESMKDLFGRTRAPKTMVVLANADHFHFCDGVETTHEMFRKMGGLTSLLDPAGKGADPMAKAKPASELCPGESAYRFLDGLGLAHLDAHLQGNPAARALLADIPALLAGQGITARVAGG